MHCISIIVGLNISITETVCNTSYLISLFCLILRYKVMLQSSFSQF